MLIKVKYILLSVIGSHVIREIKYLQHRKGGF